MTGAPGSALRALSHPARALRRLAVRQPAMVPAFKGGTLDIDDVMLALDFLAGDRPLDDPNAVEHFEKDFAQHCNAGYAFAFDSGRAALSGILSALDLEPGTEVILPGYTCVVVANAVRYARLTPVYCDIELETFGLDADSVAARLTAQTRVVVVQHLYGLVSRDLEAILDLAASEGIAVVEDCAHAAGATLNGQPVGTFGSAAFYSCEQSKVLSTTAGGVATTRDSGLGEAIRRVVLNAPPPAAQRVRALLETLLLNYYICKHPHRWWRGAAAELRWGGDRVATTTAAELEGLRPEGYGCRLPGALAVVGSNQLRKLARYNRERRRVAARWDGWVREKGFAPPTVIPGSEPVFLRYPVLVAPEQKRDTRWVTRELGVEAGKWFTSNLHPSSIEVAGCPNADRAVRCCINLPTLLH